MKYYIINNQFDNIFIPVWFSLRVQYILNVTREIDNFFPGVFEYHNIRVYDEEATDLLAYWNDTYKFISRAKWVWHDCMFHFEE